MSPEGVMQITLASTALTLSSCRFG